MTLPALAEPVTVAALGDSLTQGFGLVPEQGFVPQMQGYLDASELDVTLINAGVSGDTTAGGLSRIDWTLTEEVDAVIVALGANDMLRGLPPEQARANLDAILSKIAARGLPALLVGIDAPPNYGAEYEQAFEAMYPDLAEQYGALYFPNFLQGLADLGDLELVMREHMQGDRIHPNASGVALIVEAMGPVVTELIGRADP
ncbi:MAG: arylesterase [Litoreibacter sp.]|nr:arylesterase [Litoreibacter sp.]